MDRRLRHPSVYAERKRGMTTRSLNRLFTYNEWAWRAGLPKPCRARLRRSTSLSAPSSGIHSTAWPFTAIAQNGPGCGEYGATVRRAGQRRRISLRSNAVRAAWTPLWAEWQEFLGSLTPGALAETVRSRNSQGVEYNLLLDDVLRHVINHATEHRSQMTPTLAQLGYPTEPLDYARFAAVEK